MFGIPNVVCVCCFCPQVNVQRVVHIYPSQCLYILQDVQAFLVIFVIVGYYHWWCIHSDVVEEALLLWFGNLELKNERRC